MQQALAGAAEAVSGEHGADLKKRMRTGTVVTTDDRNWELRFTQSAKRMSLSRAVGVDMESATIAGQGYRFRVPYGTLLCVSDKPLHGEIKLPGQANAFYEEAIAAHLQIGVNACKRLREEGPRLHSRKLRAFNEPPFSAKLSPDKGESHERTARPLAVHRRSVLPSSPVPPAAWGAQPPGFSRPKALA